MGGTARKEVVGLPDLAQMKNPQRSLYSRPKTKNETRVPYVRPGDVRSWRENEGESLKGTNAIS